MFSKKSTKGESYAERSDADRGTSRGAWRQGRGRDASRSAGTRRGWILRRAGYGGSEWRDVATRRGGRRASGKSAGIRRSGWTESGRGGGDSHSGRCVSLRGGAGWCAGCGVATVRGAGRRCASGVTLCRSRCRPPGCVGYWRVRTGEAIREGGRTATRGRRQACGQDLPVVGGLYF